jgi:hypothetical protein
LTGTPILKFGAEPFRHFVVVKLKSNESQIWQRFLEMADHPDPDVRRWIVQWFAAFLKNAFGRRGEHTTPSPDAEGQFHAAIKIGDAHVLFGNGYFSDSSMAAALYLG